MPSLIHRLCVVALLMLTALSARAVDTLFVREELGLSFLPTSTSFLLPLDGASSVYANVDDDLFSLAYTGGYFVMKALADNEVCACLPYGLDIYRAGGAYITPAHLDATTSLDFVPWFEFPTSAGEEVRIKIAAVPEPSVLAMLAAGLALLWAAAARRGRALRQRID
ncbi:PEP-CTERM sorting domain-containing protein [Rivibacter subsaxonicus]|uniref:Putative secreted protein with PEP-CTERM sorting signal n=1 Tax=Rivibacter subsaxonicus TaxID=457575 RepID=A0A4Q7VWI2_9BURK|nr:PEP-CTERM sorting domain-containing protein [Rivibacter subsaxonicus]RZU01094.1 putative secreted protein with PEP-CTERM sorting signal [Rivibacter subsaxonicus]